MVVRDRPVLTSSHELALKRAFDTLVATSAEPVNAAEQDGDNPGESESRDTEFFFFQTDGEVVYNVLNTVTTRVRANHVTQA